MYPAPFDYFRPSSVDEALALLARYGDDAKLLAGGHSLIPAMKLRLARPAVVVDIGRIADLAYIRQLGPQIAIGATTTHHAIERSALLGEKCPLLPETAATIGDMQVRNRGTIGGSLAHADPAADWPAAILALDAELELAGPAGRRTVGAGEFFVDLFQTAMAPNEVLCEIRVPVTGPTIAYEKAHQKASGFALAGVAVVVGDGQIRIGVTGVAATPYRARAVERALGGQISRAPALLQQAAESVGEGVRALGDIHASPEYRLHLAAVNTLRALTRALNRS
jgi:carbon-monoxide dehydrogenase medium subunit